MKFLLSFQGLAAVFNISLGIVSWWTSKESERYNRLIQLRVFVFCVNILHAYITGPIIYQNDDTPMLAPGMIFLISSNLYRQFFSFYWDQITLMVSFQMCVLKIGYVLIIKCVYWKLKVIFGQFWFCNNF